MREKLIRPTYLYLQNKQTDAIDDQSWTPRHPDSVTWSKDEVNKHDTLYVRADIIPEETLERLGIPKERVEL